MSPINSKVLLVSNIAAQATGGETSWISLDAGKTWLTSDSLVLVPSTSDPAVAIGRISPGGPNGRFFVNHLDTGVSDGALGIHYKDSTGPGTAWTHVQVSPGKSENGNPADKNHLAINNNTSGTFTNRMISAWQDVGLAGPQGIRAAISTNNGMSWVSGFTISESQTGKSKRNVNVQWGRPDSSKAFACWSVAPTSPVGAGIDAVWFAASNNGGGLWLPVAPGKQVAAVDGFVLAGKVAEFGDGGAPAMAVDMNNGHIYVAYSSRNSSQEADVFVAKSTDNGHTWGAPTVVHAPSTPGKDQWQPWIAWDDCTGAVVVVFFDSRHSAGDVHTFLSVKYPDSETWTDFRVSDASWSGDNGFAGHYIGVAAKDGIAFPMWSDDREVAGIYKPYVSPIYLWGVEQSSVHHTFVSAPGMQLAVGVDWDTNIEATGTDYLVLTSPSNVVYVVPATPAGPDFTEHAVEMECSCEPGHWTYVVKSTRPGFTPRGSNLKGISIPCIE